MKIVSLTTEEDFNSGTYIGTKWSNTEKGVIPSLTGSGYYKKASIAVFGAGVHKALTVHKGEGTDSSTDVYLNNNVQNWPNSFDFEDEASNHLDFWIESYDENEAKVYIELPSTEQDIYILYGDDGAQSHSFDDTFILRDSAENGDPDRWNVPEPTHIEVTYDTTQKKNGSKSVKINHINSSQSDYAYMQCDTGITKGRVRFYIRIPSAAWGNEAYVYIYGSDEYICRIRWHGTSGVQYWNGTEYADTGESFSEDVWEWYEIRFDKSDHSVDIYKYKSGSWSIIQSNAKAGTWTGNLNSFYSVLAYQANWYIHLDDIIAFNENTTPLFEWGTEQSTGTHTYATALIPAESVKKFIGCFVEDRVESGASITYQVLDSEDTVLATLTRFTLKDLRNISEKIKIKATFTNVVGKTAAISKIWLSYIPTSVINMQYKIGSSINKIFFDRAEVSTEFSNAIPFHKLKRSNNIYCDNFGQFSQSITLNILLSTYNDIEKLMSLEGTQTTLTLDALHNVTESYNVFIHNVEYTHIAGGLDGYFECQISLSVVE